MSQIPSLVSTPTVLALAGSPAARSRSTALLRNVAGRLRGGGVTVHELGVHDLPATDLVGGAYAGPAAVTLRARVHAADALVIATPIYKASFAGALKALLDLLDERALVGKTVLPIATGGSPAHLLAIEYGLKPVLSALGARHILGGVYASDAQLAWNDDGSVQLDPAIAGRLEDNLADLRRALHREVARPLPERAAA